MDLADDLWAGQDEDVVGALEVVVVVLEALAAELIFGQRVALDHRAHRAVDDEDALRQVGFEPGDAGGVLPGQSLGHGAISSGRA